MAAQDIVCDTLGLLPIPINGKFEACFDAFRDGWYFEIKSVKLGSAIPVYKWRIEKEQRAAAHGVNLAYAILVHRLKNEHEDIRRKLAASAYCVVIIPAALVHSLAMECREYKVERGHHWSKRNGYEREGYIEGYKLLPVKRILEAAPIGSISYSLPVNLSPGMEQWQ